MRYVYFGLAALSALVSASAAALIVDNINLAPGEQISVEFGTDGRPQTTQEAPARMSQFDQAMLVQLLAHPEAVGPNGVFVNTGQRAPAIEDGKLRISFIRIAGPGGRPESLLILENGYDRGFKYGANIYRSDSGEPTDVCMVVPKLRGYEHWPYPIERIELTRLTLVPYREGTQPVCE